jgi:hypothetical protein
MEDSSTGPYSESGFKPAPLLGEANEYVYMDLLGLTQKEYKTFIQKGIIG